MLGGRPPAQADASPREPASGRLLQLTVDGVDVAVPDDGGSLLDLLRDRLGKRSVKDGCSPQGQCGCCTVWIDGQPRVSCVTAARRAAGRTVTTFDGVSQAVRDRWVDAFVASGASQCGFCTPGIVMRLAAAVDPEVLGGDAGARRARRAPDATASGSADAGRDAVERALAAHLCRCTGWQPIVDAARQAVAAATGPSPAPAERDLAAAARRAAIEGGTAQRVGTDVVCGRAGFAEDTAPEDALVAVLDAGGSWVVAESLAEARALAGKRQGRNTTLAVTQPLVPPDGVWDLVLATAFVEPAYLEPDASWCAPGGEPATPLANGGAFGGKRASRAPAAARELAQRHGRPVRVVLSREDVVRLGPKRPPIAAGVADGGRGVLRVARTPGGDLGGWSQAVASVAPGLDVEVVEVPGPPVSAALRGAGWVEAAVLLAGLAMRADAKQAGGERSDAAGRWPAARVRSPAGSEATASVAADGSIAITIEAGAVLDEVVLRSYCVGAAHQALGWVRSEGVAVDHDGEVRDLTIRSFGVLPARSMPPVAVTVLDGDGPPVPGGDAVFAAVAAAAWAERGFAPAWPTDAVTR